MEFFVIGSLRKQNQACVEVSKLNNCQQIQQILLKLGIPSMILIVYCSLKNGEALQGSCSNMWLSKSTEVPDSKGLTRKRFQQVYFLKTFD